MPDGIRGLLSGPMVAGALQGLAIGGMTDWVGLASQGRNLQVACYQDTTDGTPAGTPSLRFDNWGFWRFRWAVATGINTKTLFAKQVVNQSPRPSIKVKANAAIGLVADVETFAAAGVGWLTITVSFVSTSPGVVWVELWNNLNTAIYCPCLFSGPEFVVWHNGVPMLDTNDNGGGGPAAAGYHRIVSPRQEQSRSP